MPDKGQSPEHGRQEPLPSDSHPSFLIVSTMKVPSPSPTDPNHRETYCFGDGTYRISHNAALSFAHHILPVTPVLIPLALSLFSPATMLRGEHPLLRLTEEAAGLWRKNLEIS